MTFHVSSAIVFRTKVNSSPKAGFGSKSPLFLPLAVEPALRLDRFFRRAMLTRKFLAVYGNQIFRHVFSQLVTGGDSSEVTTLWLYNLINVECELVGCYLAALLIDHKLMVGKGSKP